MWGETIVYLSTALIAGILIYLGSRKKKVSQQVPLIEIENDKFILVQTDDLDLLKKTINDFHVLHNEGNGRIFFKLVKTNNNEYCIFFPYNISLEYFCYFINYIFFSDLTLPEVNTHIRGWLTADKGEIWIKGYNFNEPLMVYIPDEERDADCVYIVTERKESADSGYKISFAMDPEIQSLESSLIKYDIPPYKIDELKKNDVLV